MCTIKYVPKTFHMYSCYSYCLSRMILQEWSSIFNNVTHYGAGSHREETCSPTIENDESHPNHRLLVMQQNGIVVATPIRLGDTCASIQQAKAAVVEDVQQLMLMVQCVHDVVPSNKCSKPDWHYLYSIQDFDANHSVHNSLANWFSDCLLWLETFMV